MGIHFAQSRLVVRGLGRLGLRQQPGTNAAWSAGWPGLPATELPASRHPTNQWQSLLVVVHMITACFVESLGGSLRIMRYEDNKTDDLVPTSRGQGGATAGAGVAARLLLKVLPQGLYATPTFRPPDPQDVLQDQGQHSGKLDRD